MKPAEAARILSVHGERAQEACALATQKDDPATVKAVFEVASAMIEVSESMASHWHAAVESTPSAIRTFFFGGSIDQRINTAIVARYRRRELETSQPVSVAPLSEEDIMTRVAHVVSDEFDCQEPMYRLNDQVFEVSIGDGKVIEFAIKKMKT
jgi:DNA-binding transcriptional ArsR family regulator